MKRLLSLLPLGLTAHACAGHKPSLPEGTPAEIVQGFGERGGLVLEQDAYGDSATRLVYLDQGWGPAETIWYYHADQGSVLLPYQTLVNLELPDSTEKVISPTNLTKYRFMLQHATPNNPDALPVGFSRQKDSAGFTCAACHTRQINYQGTAMRIDGAPALADLTGFLRSLEPALKATLDDPAKLARFAAALPGGGTDAASVEEARASLQRTYDWFHSYNTANASTTVEGFARIDAVVRIVNQVIRFTSDPKNAYEPNSPASLPFLWDAPRHDYVQWAGFGPNAQAGSLGRNAGEVIGVYGDVKVVKHTTEEEAKQGYVSTVSANALVSMEETLRDLESPVWPAEILGAIDQEKASRGAEIYAQQCVSCHADIDRDDPNRKVVAWMVGVDKVGTDRTAVDNLTGAAPPAGILEGAINPRDGSTYGATVPALTLLQDLVFGVLSQNKEAALRAVANAKLAGIEKTELQGDYTRATEADPLAPLRSYKARPLNGIWATSPYLHNGSVPDLYSLLLPADQRPSSFSVGRLEFDPVKVGQVSSGTEPFMLDTRVKGNSNGGHLYGTTLSEADRWALVEHLKTL